MFSLYSSRACACLLAVATVAIFSMPYGQVEAGERFNLDGLRSTGEYDRFVVKYREGSSPREDAAALEIALNRAARAIPSTRNAIGVQRLRRLAIGADVIKVSRKLDSIEAELLMRQIAVNPAVEYVELDRRSRPDFIPNDTEFSEQYGLKAGAGGIRATDAWDVADGFGIVVAVIDTGFVSHEDLNANLLQGYDFIADATASNDGDGRDAYATDEYWGCPPDFQDVDVTKPDALASGHGNHVAGIIAAVTNNSLGVAGVAHGAQVVPIRALAQCAGYDSDVADAIVWASGGVVNDAPFNENPATVINLSLGREGQCGNAFQDAINVAVSNGTTVVVSAGNDNQLIANKAPANCAHAVVVGSTSDEGARSSFSNFGGVTIAAPGEHILSTYLNNTYTSFSGTSMSAPHVAGVVALMQGYATTLKSPSQIEALLAKTARDFPVPPSRPLGAGIVNAKAAIAAVNCVPGTTESDFNCDGEADIVWRNRYDGQNVVWHSGDANDQPVVESVGTDWDIVGVGHFNDDSRADLLWRSSTGRNAIWHGAERDEDRALVTVSDLEWEVAGVGDFNGDGTSDILWRHLDTGDVSIWIDGDYHSRRPTQEVKLIWDLAGVGDLDSDGQSDILWRHTTTGNNYVWRSGFKANGEWLESTVDLNWNVGGIGDFDADGHLDDILWRHGTTGKNYLWLSAEKFPGRYLETVNLYWDIEGILDMDGDGTSDILWRKGSRNVVWYGGEDPHELTPVGGSAWQIVP